MVQVPMVVHIHDFGVHQVFQFFQVHYETGDRVDIALYRNFQGVVMAMSVAIGAFAKDAGILFRRPFVIPVIMGSSEFGFSGQ
jgi:hypothetical protein